jgi:hypothetical protein
VFLRESRNELSKSDPFIFSCLNTNCTDRTNIICEIHRFAWGIVSTDHEEKQYNPCNHVDKNLCGLCAFAWDKKIISHTESTKFTECLHPHGARVKQIAILCIPCFLCAKKYAQIPVIRGDKYSTWFHRWNRFPADFPLDWYGRTARASFINWKFTCWKFVYLRTHGPYVRTSQS